MNRRKHFIEDIIVIEIVNYILDILFYCIWSYCLGVPIVKCLVEHFYSMMVLLKSILVRNRSIDACIFTHNCVINLSERTRFLIVDVCLVADFMFNNITELYTVEPE